jgi:NitT/TauT family transport system ATP-binding protein
MTYQAKSGAVEAIRDVDITIQRGSIVSLVGHSGSGKSTLLKLMAGLMKPTSGTIEVNGEPAREGRRDCGIMMQSPVLFPWRTVLDNVLLPSQVFKLDKAEARHRAMELLDFVGLAGFEKKKVWELSGGMKQRASLARLLIFDPDILFMDEPFGALDEFTRERLDKEVLQLQYKFGRTVVYVTHNIREAVLLSDRIVVLGSRPGRVLDEVTVTLAKPRDPETVESDEGRALVEHIRELLFTQVQEVE